MKKPAALIILDGWGYNPDCTANAICGAKTPNFDRLMKEWPNTLLSASGLDVGLPEGQMGNSEVGHLNIGSGRIIYQELTRITKSIKDGDFFTNPDLLTAFHQARDNGKKLHVMGLLSDGGVHSHMDHVKAIFDMAKLEGLNDIYLHAFLDGRDTPPHSGAGFVKEIRDHMLEIGTGKVATVSGRYYAMDRDKRWERVELGYNMLVKGEGNTSEDAVACVEGSYAAGKTDEFMIPTVIMENGNPVAKVEEGDSVLFFNFRPDRARQITRAFVDPEFNGFNREYFKLHYVCMTQYDLTMPNVLVAYKPQSIENTLGEYIASKGLKQLRIAETEKYAHVTFFFNGGVEEPNEGEERILIQSPKVETYDMKPEMSAVQVTDALIEQLDKDDLDLIILNFANPDMVGHTGIYDAAVSAVETVDTCLGRVVGKILEMGGGAIVTADHGNAEVMVDPESGKPMTAHTTNQVPCIAINCGATSLMSGGKLSDLAPSLLEVMELDQPVQMTGKSLFIK